MAESPVAGALAFNEFDDEGVAGDLREMSLGQADCDLEDRIGSQRLKDLEHELWVLTSDRLWVQLQRELRGRVWFRVAEEVRKKPNEIDFDTGTRAVLKDDVSLWRDGNDLTRATSALHIVGLLESPCLQSLFEACRQNAWWWPMHQTVVLTDRPTLIVRDGQGRPHCAGGPAVQYADGYTLHYWHGTLIPAWITQGPTVEAALAEPNVEVRRCAIEAIGWARFIAEAGLTKVAECPDPGNAPHALTLWELPQDMRDAFGRPARILLCTNGTPDRSGRVHQFGLTAPTHHDDPVEARRGDGRRRIGFTQCPHAAPSRPVLLGTP